MHRPGNFLRKIYEHLILPFLETHAPIHQGAWGAALGVFVGLTPTMGVQMYIVAAIWMVVRGLLRLNFNLPIAVAMVWISNPVTVIPLYYAFLVTGNFFLGLGAGFSEAIDYRGFQEILAGAGSDAGASWLERVMDGAGFLFWNFGWPLIVGGLIWAAPSALLTYPVAMLALLKYRRALAQREGMPYDQWRRLRVRPE